MPLSARSPGAKTFGVSPGCSCPRYASGLSQKLPWARGIAGKKGNRINAQANCFTLKLGSVGDYERNTSLDLILISAALALRRTHRASIIGVMDLNRAVHIT